MQGRGLKGQFLADRERQQGLREQSFTRTFRQHDRIPCRIEVTVGEGALPCDAVRIAHNFSLSYLFRFRPRNRLDLSISLQYILFMSTCKPMENRP